MIRSALSVSLSLCLSVDLLLVALIIEASFSTLSFYQNACVYAINPLPPFLPHVVRPQAPKSSHLDPWRPKKLSNSISKNSKFVMKNASAARLLQRTLSKLDFFDLLSIFEAPRASQNWAKIAKIRKKCLKFDVEKSILFNIIFSRLFFASTSQIDLQIEFFSIFFENVLFAKILAKHWLCAQKSRFGLPKNEEN